MKVWINGIQRNVLNEIPYIYTIDNFIDDNKCNHIINISKGNFNPALVISVSNGIISNERSGLNYWIEHNDDNIIKEICERISKLVRIPLTNAENVQVIYYKKGQEYRKHFDAFNKKTIKGLKHTKFGGNRIVTCIVYLNNVESGGSTLFPMLGIEVKPKKGKLLVFYNCENEKYERPHRNSLHAGSPVLEGEKYAFTLWFREKDIKKNYYED